MPYLQVLQVGLSHCHLLSAASWLNGCCKVDVPCVLLSVLEVGEHMLLLLCSSSALERLKGLHGDYPRADLSSLQQKDWKPTHMQLCLLDKVRIVVAADHNGPCFLQKNRLAALDNQRCAKQGLFGAGLLCCTELLK